MSPANILARMRTLGLRASLRKAAQLVRMRADRLALHGVRLIFRFDPWHANSPVSARPYRTALAERINQLDPRHVVEVGCGLGAILAKLQAPERHGYDLDERVIRAARMLQDRRIHFHVGGFEQVSAPTVDVLIAVNWTHDVSAEELRNALLPLLRRVRYLLVDAILPGTPGYRHYHDFAFLGSASLVWADTLGEPNRTFLLYELAEAPATRPD